MPRSQQRILALTAAATLVMAVVIGLDSPRRGLLAGGLALGVVLLLAVRSGRRGRHTPWSQAEARLAPDHAVVLWEPGCMYCERLLLQIGSDPRVTWVNVWQDEEANRRVRAVDDGDELNPTVLLGEQVLRNPSAAELRAALAGPAAPGGAEG